MEVTTNASAEHTRQAIGRLTELPAGVRVVQEALEATEDGFLPLHDKSSPEAVARRFEMSKRVFKAAVGGLYKRELIELLRDGIRLRQHSGRGGSKS